MKVKYSKKFLKLVNKLPKHIRKKADQKESIFKRYPFSKSLKTHKLKGELEGYYAFSVNFEYRIIAKIEGEIAWFMDIGTHSIYD